MEIDGKQSMRKKEYSYPIYIAFCLAIPILCKLAPFGRINESSDTAEKFAFRLTLFFIFCSLAWVVGRRYELSYPLRCALGGAAFTLPAGIVFISSELALETVILSVIFTILGALVIGTLLLAISYPFQLLFSKLRS